MNHQRLFWITLGTILVLGAFLRLYGLGTESYWLDEIGMIKRAQEGIAAIPGEPEGRRAPAFLLLSSAWVNVSGTGEAATRLLPALIGIASLGAMAAVGAELFDRRVAVISTLLLAVSDFQIYHAQNFRFYSLFVLMTLLSVLFYARVLRTGQRRDWVLYLLASVLLYYTHAYGVFILAVQNLVVLAQWERRTDLRRKWIASQALLLVLIAPGLAFAVDDTLGGVEDMSWIPAPALWLPLRSMYKFLFADRHYPGVAPLVAVGLLLAAGVGVVMWRCGLRTWWGTARLLPDELRHFPSHAAAHAGFAGRGQVLLLVGLWLAVPLLAPFVLSRLFGPMYLHRYVINAAPAFYLLAAVVILSLRRVVPVAVSLGVLLVLAVPGLHEYYNDDVNEQWRDIAVLLEKDGSADAVIVFAPADGGVAERNLYWYYRGTMHACSIDSTVQDEDAIAAAVETCTTGRARFWLVMRGSEGYTRHFRDYFLEHGVPDCQIAQEREFVGVSVFLFERAGM
jgi:mannosyltransferase